MTPSLPCLAVVLTLTTASIASGATVSIGSAATTGGISLMVAGQTVNMTTTSINLGSGTAASAHLATGPNNNLGGTAFTGNYFDNTNFAGGPANQATRMSVADSQAVLNGQANDFKDAVGFRVKFSQAIKLNHFYILDVDGSNASYGEWSTAFALNGTQVVAPTLTTASPTNVLVLQDEDISPTWSSALGITAPTTLDVARITTGTYTNSGNGGSNPDEVEHQVLVDFGDQFADTFYFFMGGVSASAGQFGQNSGVSALNFDNTELAPIPLPATVWLMVAGLFGLRAIRTRA